MSQITGLSSEDLEAFLLLQPRVFADYRNPRQGKFGIVYNFSETVDNADSGLKKIVALARAEATYQIGICQGDTMHGYAGCEHSTQRLVQLGLHSFSVPALSIVPIRVFGNVNTGSEADALVRYAVTLGGDIGIVAPPFHLMRAFMTTVSAMVRLDDKQLCIYAIMGEHLPWTQEVRHSQGTLQNTRVGLLGNELVRLERYRAPEYGTMLTAQEVMKYLDWRDSL